MRGSSTWLWLGGCLAALAAGCATLPSPPQAVVPLDAAQERALLACQAGVNRASARFVGTALAKLDRCAGRALRLRLEEDRRLNSSTIAEFVARRAQIVAGCEAELRRIGAASTRLIESVRASCEPVEDLLLTGPDRGDPLAFRTLDSFLGTVGRSEMRFASVAELAGTLCGADLTAVGNLLAVHVPRTSDVARSYLQANMPQLGDYLRTFADPRCVEVRDV